MKKFRALIPIFCISLFFIFYGCGANEDLDAKRIAEDYLNNFTVNVLIDEETGENIGISTPAVLGPDLPTIHLLITDSYIYVYDSNLEEEIQAIPFGPVDNLEISQSNVKVLDINFDGILDIKMPFRTENENIYYYCWLWNIYREQFAFNQALSEISDLVVEPDEKILTGYYHKSEREHISYIYRWVDGRPSLVSETVIEK